MSIRRIVKRASWPRFLVSFAILFAYSWWAFNMDSPWTRALKAAGGILPESQPGFPPIEPQRSLEALGDATGDYILWQALDIPYALLTLFATAGAMSLALKALRLEASILRFLLCLPLAYVVCELVENALVASFASGLLPVQENIVLVQQLATTVKFGTGMPSLMLGLLSVIIALVAALFRAFRKSA